MRENTEDYRAIFLSGTALLDVRAPVEFSKGAFPNTINLPLLNDLERQKIGTCYKNHGQDAAISLGHRLVCGDIKAQRIQAWQEFTRHHPSGFLYCFRGGLRSKISQQWLRDEAGVAYPRIIGGYKAMRGFLCSTLEAVAADCEFTVIGGLTGTGKTEVLRRLDHHIDLEGHANHRGSSFGRHATPQPVQINFENALAIDFLRKREAGMRQFVLEDESRGIGSCSVPLPLHNRMQTVPVIWLEDCLANRVERILQDYVVKLCGEFTRQQGAEGFDAFAQRLRRSLDRIVKRLGGERHRRFAEIMDAALAEQARSGDVELHRPWIEGLLNEYYDPMYAYQLEKKAQRIVFRGDQRAVLNYLRQLPRE